MVLVVKNLPANAGDARGITLIPGSGRSPVGRNGTLLQHSGLENSKDRGVWQARLHRVVKRQTQLEQLTCTQVADKLSKVSSIIF